MRATPIKMCCRCHKRQATIPDRETMSPVPRFCSECHAAKLAGDFRAILQLAEKKRRGEV